MRRNVKTKSRKWSFELRAVVFVENGHYVAQCVDRDIAAQGKDFESVKEAFTRAIVGQAVLDIRHGREPFAGIREAPPYYLDLFDRAEPLKRPLELEGVPPAFMIAETDLRLLPPSPSLVAG